MITADNITPEQIKSLWSTCPNGITGRTLMAALNEPLWDERQWTADDVSDARAECARVLNRITNACRHGITELVAVDGNSLAGGSYLECLACGAKLNARAAKEQG